jgi:hypothetical protein
MRLPAGSSGYALPVDFVGDVVDDQVTAVAAARDRYCAAGHGACRELVVSPDCGGRSEPRGASTKAGAGWWPRVNPGRVVAESTAVSTFSTR